MAQNGVVIIFANRELAHGHLMVKLRGKDAVTSFLIQVAFPF
jgi:hypothetical protein